MSVLKALRNFVLPLITTPEQKMDYLNTKTYQFYVDLFSQQEMFRAARDMNGVEIPKFQIQKQIRETAFQKANEELAKIIDECRIDECFKKALRA